MHLPALGRLGIWTGGLDLQPTTAGIEAAAEIEELGFGTLWLSEGLVRDPFLDATALLGATRSLVVGTGIAVIWLRHPRAVRGMTRALLDVHPRRFVLGLGTSDATTVEHVLGMRFERPLAEMRRQLDQIDAPDPVLAPAGGSEPPPPRVLAALGPRALELARDRAAGALTYLGTPEHTAQARAVLGPDRTLVVEQAVVVGTPADQARERARTHLAGYLPAAPYRSSWQRLGFTDADFAAGGSDRLVAALVAVGEEQVADRVAAHLAAGADQVCLQALPPAVGTLPLDQWRLLAPVRLPDPPASPSPTPRSGCAPTGSA
jgi:probable F420-dependent oxidoreductase